MVRRTRRRIRQTIAPPTGQSVRDAAILAPKTGTASRPANCRSLDIGKRRQVVARLIDQLLRRTSAHAAGRAVTAARSTDPGSPLWESPCQTGQCLSSESPDLTPVTSPNHAASEAAAPWRSDTATTAGTTERIASASTLLRRIVPTERDSPDLRPVGRLTGDERRTEPRTCDDETPASERTIKVCGHRSPGRDRRRSRRTRRAGITVEMARRRVGVPRPCTNAPRSAHRWPDGRAHRRVEHRPGQRRSTDRAGGVGLGVAPATTIDVNRENRA